MEIKGIKGKLKHDGALRGDSDCRLVYEDSKEFLTIKSQDIRAALWRKSDGYSFEPEKVNFVKISKSISLINLAPFVVMYEDNDMYITLDKNQEPDILFKKDGWKSEPYPKPEPERPKTIKIDGVEYDEGFVKGAILLMNDITDNCSYIKFDNLELDSDAENS